MRKYELKERKEISKIICNKCGKEIPVSETIGEVHHSTFRTDQRHVSLRLFLRNIPTRSPHGTPLSSHVHRIPVEIEG